MATNGDTAMAEQEEMDTTERTEDYQKLVDYGIDVTVAGELDTIYKSGMWWP